MGQSNVCYICRKRKPIAEFSPEPRNLSGVRNDCRECRSDRAKARKASGLEIPYSARVAAKRVGLPVGVVLTLMRLPCSACGRPPSPGKLHRISGERSPKAVICRECAKRLAWMQSEPEAAAKLAALLAGQSIL